MTDYDDFTKVTQIMNELNAMEVSGHSIYSISLYNSKNKMLLTSEKKMSFFPNEEMNHIEQLVDKEAGSPHWFLEKWPVSTYLTLPTNYITYPILLDPSDSSYNTVLFVHVSESTISDYIKELNQEDNGLTTWVLTGDGTSLIQSSADSKIRCPFSSARSLCS
ncbi:hypothetical protein SD70_22855 [Gordoniibacillus kamchatkensis]|uniref:Cache domain-containing protein n=1 Tax=Gordoniibacillus kamchatkensis TaxID=1590651 RepID=A0ABR5AD73_9BACL|nr:hypothetical protein SD70_22855 [Paenibacillus sp. VKM B-2647]